MTAEKLAEILEKHKKWLNGEKGGERANLQRANLQDANLQYAHLQYANLQRANLQDAHLLGAHLLGAHLQDAHLLGAHLQYANLQYAHLQRAHLQYANLQDAHLQYANLLGAHLLGANLQRANLQDANLSETNELLSAVDYIDAHFERVEAGYIAYKTFNCEYNAPETWKIEPGAVLSENVNANRTDLYGCGVNVAPLEWVKRKYQNRPIWKVLIRWEWLAGVCVPYNTDGKIRCERVELLEVVE